MDMRCQSESLGNLVSPELYSVSFGHLLFLFNNGHLYVLILEFAIHILVLHIFSTIIF